MRKILSIENLFLLTIFSMPLYLVRMNIFGLPTNVFELLAILAIGFFITNERKNIKEKFLGLPKSLSISIVLILSGVLLSILFNNNYSGGFGILKSWFLIPIFFSFALFALLDLKEKIEKVFLSIYLSTALVAIISITYGIAGIMTYDNRLSSFYMSPNYLAMYLAPGFFFGLYFLLKSIRNNKYSNYILANIFLLALILIPIYYTYSYATWSAILLSLFIVSLFFMPKRKYTMASLLFVAIAFGIITTQLGNPKFSSLLHFSDRSSFASRMMIWNSSFLMIKQHPLIGIGPGNFQEKYLALQPNFPPYLEWAVPEPHNIFLAFWLQAGILGLLGFLLLLYFLFHSLWKILQNKKDATLATPLLGFFIYTVLHGLVDTPYWKNDLAFLFWICIFIATKINTLNSPTTQRIP